MLTTRNCSIESTGALEVSKKRQQAGQVRVRAQHRSAARLDSGRPRARPKRKEVDACCRQADDDEQAIPQLLFVLSSGRWLIVIYNGFWPPECELTWRLRETIGCHCGAAQLMELQWQCG